MRNITVGTSSNVASAMAEVLGPRQSVLDMGSGSGVLCSAIVERWPGTHLTAVDVRHQESTVGADRFVQGDVLTLDWTSRFSGIISNPPYERTIDIGPARRDELRERFYSARGQFDLWFTFVERALQLLEPRGRGVFLIPGGLETRPAAARLRDVLNAYSAWRVDRDVGAAFADSVGVCPELLIFDRNDETWGQAHQRWSHLFDVDERVSVGAATGSGLSVSTRGGRPLACRAARLICQVRSPWTGYSSRLCCSEFAECRVPLPGVRVTNLARESGDGLWLGGLCRGTRGKIWLPAGTLWAIHTVSRSALF